MAEGMSAHRLFEKCSPMGAAMQLERGLPVVRLSTTDGSLLRGQCSRLSSQQQVGPMQVGIDPRGLPSFQRPATAIGHFDADCGQISNNARNRTSSEGRLARPREASIPTKRAASTSAVGQRSAKEPAPDARRRAASTGTPTMELASDEMLKDSRKKSREQPARLRRERSSTPGSLRLDAEEAAVSSRKPMESKRPHSAVRSPLPTPPSSQDTRRSPMAPRGLFSQSSPQASFSMAPWSTENMNGSPLNQPIRGQEPEETDLLPLRARPNGVVNPVAQRRHYHPSRWGRLGEMFKNKGGPHWSPTLPGGGVSLLERKNHYSMVTWPESKLGSIAFSKMSAATQDCVAQPWE